MFVWLNELNIARSLMNNDMTGLGYTPLYCPLMVAIYTAIQIGEWNCSYSHFKKHIEVISNEFELNCGWAPS